MNVHSQTYTVPYFPCNCQGRLLSSRVLVVRYSWVENKFPFGMVMGSDMVLGGGSRPIPMCKLLSSQLFCCCCFFPLIRNQDSNLIPCKLGTLTITCKSQMPAPSPPLSPQLKCQIQYFVASDDVT